MGPGYMPMLVFLILGTLGIAVLVTAFVNGPDPLERWAWRELALVLGAMTVFALALEHLGLAISTAVLVGISSLADRSQTPLGGLGCVVVLVALTWLVFVVGLRVSIPSLPLFIANN